MFLEEEKRESLLLYDNARRIFRYNIYTRTQKAEKLEKIIIK